MLAVVPPPPRRARAAVGSTHALKRTNPVALLWYHVPDCMSGLRFFMDHALLQNVAAFKVELKKLLFFLPKKDE